MAFIQSYLEVADALEGKSISMMNKIAREAECRNAVNRVMSLFDSFDGIHFQPILKKNQSLIST